MKIIGLGACVLDTLIMCYSFPMEDTKSRAEEIKTVCGGPVANALTVAVKMGIEAKLLNPLATDNSGNAIRSSLKDRNIDLSESKELKGESSFVSYILLSKNSGSRTCLFNRGTVKDQVENINLSAIDGADILHLDGNYINCAIAAAKYAKERGVLVSLDAGGVYPDIEKLLPLVDILIPSEEFALKITKTDRAEKAMLLLKKKYNPKVLVITQGVNGGIYYDDGIYKYSSFKVNCVDSNGAGDTFHGAFLAQYLKGNSLSDCCVTASAASAVKCSCFGFDDENFNYENIIKLANG